jgi:hypothetical protein
MAATLYAAASAGVILLGALLPRGKRLPDPARALVPVAAWIAAAMLSVLERQHVNYPYLAVPAFVVLLALWIRSAAPDRLAGGLAAASVIAAFALLHNVPFAPRIAAGAIPPRQPAPGLEPVAAPRRTEGALFRPADRMLVAHTAELMRRASFGPGDTWLDFANAPALYFLFDRPCPIRYYEVPFYESDAAQREVIAAVEANPRVRAVLVSGTYPPIDGVSSAERAPLVARFIRERFRPFLDEDGVAFWIRNGDRAAPAQRETPGP